AHLSHLHSFPTRRSSDLAKHDLYGRRYSTCSRKLLSFRYHHPRGGILSYGTLIRSAYQSRCKRLVRWLPSSAERNSYSLRQWFRSEEHTSELQSRENLVC